VQIEEMDELENVGNRVILSKVYSVSQATINFFAQVSGGMGAIHTDPIYAKGTFFKNTLVHGLYILALIEKEFDLQINNPVGKKQIEVTYLRPILVDQEFYFKFTSKNKTKWEVTVLSNEEPMIFGEISI
jgi:acyl dehydratase